AIGVAQTHGEGARAQRREEGGMGDGEIVRGMALLRVLSGSLELAAAYLMIRWGRVDHAMRINGLLGLVGPTVLLLVSLLGLASLSVHLPWPRLGLIACGVALILLGTR
ncbi:MAG: DUF2619 domain-containing protein, partial [Bacillota bacterium]